ncbi:MAG: Guanosine polyphosphate pyrophosphohydrolase/synthetase [Rickettsiaceae bacterium]|jgi:GTP pyrophosphokinase|nr:Guanosine polyphosphate pyrophosphohydrolase/synthetase [Rickettsiaceae bacterium]
MLSGNELVEKIKKYHTNFDEKLVLDAYEISLNSHSSQFRSSGDPYFSHPLAVAEILIDYKLDATSVITALLHDVVEDTEVTLEVIEEKFGEKIASLVDGVTKLSKIESLSHSQKTAENFRKLVMAVSQDIRVLLVKLADRLHNMQTLNFIKSEEKRIRIASESLSIYAPLAARIGMYKIRDELQDLSFAQINPDARNYIKNKLDELRESEKDIIEKIIVDLSSKLSSGKINFEISGREKQPYSIWNKMKSQSISFGHLHDIMGFRIVVDDVASCYMALGVINSNYNMIPGSFKDYISTPKENGYRSIHLLTLGPQNKKIEIQIRTKEMHKVAESGVAAHWSYKEKNKIDGKESEQYKWIRDLISLFEQMEDPGEILRDHKIQMHKDQVFCFTPGGDVFNLPVGATIIDFAYAVHSEIGNKCVSAKVNGISTSLRQKLENGDQVEIITDSNSKPSPAWLQFATTYKAKAAIKHFIRNKKHAEYVALGKAILNKFFASKNLAIDEKMLEGVLRNFNKKTVDDLYVFVTEGLVARTDILKAIYPEHQESQKKPKKEKTNKADWFKEDYSKKDSLPIQGLISGMAMHLARCCHPIPGDNIIGVISTGSGVTIHSQNCVNLKTIALNPLNLLDVCWKEDEGDNLYQSRVVIVMNNTAGSLAEVSSAIARKKINITNIKINSRSADFFEVVIDIEVKNTEHLEEVMSILRMSKNVIEVKTSS